MSAVTFVCGHLTRLSQICLDAIIQCAIALAGEDQEWSPHASSSFSHFQPPVWLALSPSPSASPFSYFIYLTSTRLLSLSDVWKWLVSLPSVICLSPPSYMLSKHAIAEMQHHEQHLQQVNWAAAASLRADYGERRVSVCDRSCREEDC